MSQICTCHDSRAAVTCAKLRPDRISIFRVGAPFIWMMSPSTFCECTPTWWLHQMKTFSALLALCVGNSPVTCEFPSQRQVTRSFDVFFDLGLSKRLNKQSRRRWFETPLYPLWCHRNEGRWVRYDDCSVIAIYDKCRIHNTFLTYFTDIYDFHQRYYVTETLSLGATQ